jgi:hypothetical protein
VRRSAPSSAMRCEMVPRSAMGWLLLMLMGAVRHMPRKRAHLGWTSADGVPVNSGMTAKQPPALEGVQK